MKYIKLWLGILTLIGVDMLSKFFFYNFNYLNETTLVLPILNKGISRSLPVPFIIIIIISVVGIGVFIWLWIKKNINWFIAALLIAGTLGNLIDRLVYWWVRDFINIGLFNFPIFNLADMMLSIGICIRVIQVMLEKKK